LPHPSVTLSKGRFRGTHRRRAAYGCQQQKEKPAFGRFLSHSRKVIIVFLILPFWSLRFLHLSLSQGFIRNV
jgi:hypothetical protein